MKSAVVMAVAVLLVLSAVAVAGQPAIQKRVFQMKVAPVDPEAAKLKRALGEKKVSFDFVETPLRDTVAFLRQLLDVNVILDPAVDGAKPVTMRVNDMSAGKALQWLAKVSGAEMKIENGAVYIAAAAKAKPRYGVQPQRYPYRRSIGRAQIHLGEATTVDLHLYDDDLDDDTRKMLFKLLHEALVKELAKVGNKK
ncbi:hypothetical protein ACFL09_01105 [Planctomycetota bacterium]